VTEAIDRRERILDLVDQDDEVQVSALATRFHLTRATIRRDLAALEDDGRLKRVRGGAVGRAHGANSTAFVARSRERSRDKDRIAAVAAAMVESGDVVFFDSGTTVARVAARIPAALRADGAITVVTHSLPVIEEVMTWADPHLIVLSGLYLGEHRAFVGPQTLGDLRDLSADIAFIGCDGLTIEMGLTTAHMLIAELGAATTARARRVVVVADSSKIGRRGLTRIVPIDAVDVLVTDAAADPEQVREIRAAGIDVRLA
jgi:DeoR/GlpR family transcriptional regulator of sugar metabolism